MTPTQRSLKKLRAEGWFCAIVEHWNQYARIRQDLFGFADLIGIKENEAILIQTTSGSNVSARVNKILALRAAELWLTSPTRRIVVHGWAKRGARGKRKEWICREVEITQ